MFNLGSLYARQKNYGEAEPLIYGALLIWQQTLGMGHERTQGALRTYVELKKKMKAPRKKKKRRQEQ
jgi:hypothetical protein